MGWHATSIGTKVNAKEGVRLIFSSTVLNSSTDKAINGTSLSKRASKGLNLANSVRVLPISASSSRSQVVQDTTFVEIVLKVEVSRFEGKHMLADALRWLGTDLMSAHSLSEGKTSEGVLVSLEGVVEHSCSI